MDTAVKDWKLTGRSRCRRRQRVAGIVAETSSMQTLGRSQSPHRATPLQMFDVSPRVPRGEIDFARRAFCLDEYVGVTADDPNSLTGWLRNALVDRVGIPADRSSTSSHR